MGEELTRLSGVGWRPRAEGVEYASDSEHVFARVRIQEEGPEMEVEGDSRGVEVVFEWEGGPDGRGWTYLSTTTTTAGNLKWVSDPSAIPTEDDLAEHESSAGAMGQGQGQGDVEAPEGYWSGFSPPASPRPDISAGEDGGEEDYWASYGKSFTPAGPGGQTPARQRTPPPPPQAVDHETSSNTRSNGDPSADASGSLLRSRLEMKIASMLKRIWTSYLPGTDPEYRAITFLSLARDIHSGAGAAADGVGGVSKGGEGDGHGVRGQLEMLYEIYEVMDCKRGDTRDGFYRLVEGSLTLGPGGGGGGFGEGDRQDSSAQLNYWE